MEYNTGRRNGSAARGQRDRRRPPAQVARLAWVDVAAEARRRARAGGADVVAELAKVEDPVAGARRRVEPRRRVDPHCHIVVGVVVGVRLATGGGAIEWIKLAVEQL